MNGKITSIGIQNFKSFKEMTTIKLSDLTFLIGKNGSGKSTLIRAATIFFNHLFEEFNGGVITNDSQGFSILDDLNLDNIVNNPEEPVIFEFEWKLVRTLVKHRFYYHYIKKDKYLFLYKHEIYDPLSDEFLAQRFVMRDNDNEIEISNIEVEYSDYRSQYRELFIMTEFTQAGMKLFYESDFIDMQAFNDSQYKLWKEKGNLELMNLFNKDKDLKNFKTKSKIPYIHFKFKSYNDYDDIFPRIGMGNIEDFIINYYYAMGEEFINSKEDLIKEHFEHFNSNIKKYIEKLYLFIDLYERLSFNIAHRSLSRKEYMGAKLLRLLDYFSSNDVSKLDIRHKLRSFGIENLEIIRESSSIFKLQITKDGKKIELADTGSGFWSLCIILYMLSGRYKECEEKWIICIEEPETSLHPNFQAKLTDVFIDIINTLQSEHFNGLGSRIQFVIETHSEYMIRRLQRRIAETSYYEKSENEKEVTHKLKPEDVAINYIHTPDYEGNRVLNIEVEPWGDLFPNFPPDFLDVADADYLLQHKYKKLFLN